MRDQDEKLTTDPPRPPGTPDVDELVGDPTPSSGSTGPDDRQEPAQDDPGHEDAASDTVSVEPPD